MTRSPRGSSEALGLLQEAGLGGQRHEGRGHTAETHPRAEAEVRGRQQGLEDADEAEGRAAVGDEVDLVAVGTQEGRDVLQGFGPGDTNTRTRGHRRITDLQTLKHPHQVVGLFYSQGLFKHLDLLAALRRFSLEHVAVVRSGRGGVFRQRGAGAEL